MGRPLDLRGGERLALERPLDLARADALDADVGPDRLPFLGGNLPITPGGLGTFEAAMLGTLAVLGYGPDAAIPVLGYRLFNFWLPIPLAVLLYPTLRFGAANG